MRDKRDQDQRAGMKIERRFTTADGGAYGDIAFTTTISEIRNPDGKIVFLADPDASFATALDLTFGNGLIGWHAMRYYQF